MIDLYAVLVAVHIVAIVVTGSMWVLVDLQPKSALKAHLHDIRAVHFGSLYLVPWFLGLMYAFDRLQVPWWHWLWFPIGLAGLVFFSGLGYLFPRDADLDPFYYWTRGPALWLSMLGLLILIVCLLATAWILCWYAISA